MVFKASVLYPNEDDTKFDMSYYLKTHMPLVAKHWEPAGLKKWEVIEFGPGLDGSKPPYCVQAILTWDTPEAMAAAAGSESAKEVFGDIPNFCNKQPVLVGGDVKAES